jgi:alkanesulfonate monooxygenase SsuD/methylene tetrahydromethanopterin reductase-like flavin-dependent oxidoreductase (luciferase family)
MGERPALPLLGVVPAQFTDDPGAPLAALDAAWRLGLAGVFVLDHLWPLGQSRTRPVLECWTLVGALAARAGALGPGADPGRDRLRIGTLVTRAGLRPPSVVARMAAAAGQAAGAPMVVGVGGGDERSEAENLAFGLPFHDRAGRHARLERQLRWLAADEAGPPRPVTWAGGRGRGVRALAGRLADAWNAWGAGAEELAAGLADVRAAAEAAGRDPALVSATWGGQVLVDADAGRARARLAEWGSGRDPAEVAATLAGDPGQVLAALAELGQAGASWCVLGVVGVTPAERPAAWALLAEAAGLTPRQG